MIGAAVPWGVDTSTRYRSNDDDGVTGGRYLNDYQNGYGPAGETAGKSDRVAVETQPRTHRPDQQPNRSTNTELLTEFLTNSILHIRRAKEGAK